MNERIDELADEARIKFSSHWTHEGVDTAVITRRDLKEFAELIIKECIEVANNNRTGMEIKTNTHLTADAIEQHFGVEK